MQKAIAQLVENKTVIMIAHRLRTVVDADQILVLDDGKLVEYGTHNELIKKKRCISKIVSYSARKSWVDNLKID